MSTATIAPQHVTRVQRPRAPRSTQRPAQGELRLTRRGRVVVVLLGLLVAAAVAVAFSAVSAATDEAMPTQEIVVGSGDTLWDIAGEISAETGESVTSTISLIEDLNGLDNDMLLAGQTLVVPAS
ncbi:LysM peptidoglycan-binding domain-containing protein [Nocardioides sp. GY 10127]|uniref:LysM peptidoglycan-binding domain-containing protein n=1 Tax=Nocardioides sp. GY 10127 TaxID=2569762 RepID=UPI0010A85BB6|nr:LysM peptidoglycan-binding domain-containing protein [Nocardioides sp. GY 10127]TIC84454.1 LysM peptidoglycan-binding domain-containing protein [Nocardioides sp. GY 10127]